MSKNLEASADPGHAVQLREALAGCVDRLAAGTLPVRVAPPCEISPRGEGHFHLTPELFLQLAGTTQFRFPHGALTLAPGQALLLPPKLLHAERVRAGGRREPFRNLVIAVDGATLCCHLAHEAEPGRPGILHLESSRHAQAPRVHDWLADAARLGDELAGDGAAPTRRWAATQAGALVAAATAGVLRALAEPDRERPAEPALVARLRMLVHNQLGDPALGVRTLAQQSGCTPDYLSHLFGRVTGEHLIAYVNRLRMERAARLLRETTMAGKEIAWACGYTTPSYFVRSFRAHHGMTPKAWRAGLKPGAAAAG